MLTNLDDVYAGLDGYTPIVALVRGTGCNAPPHDVVEGYWLSVQSIGNNVVVLNINLSVCLYGWLDVCRIVTVVGGVGLHSDDGGMPLCEVVTTGFHSVKFEITVGSSAPAPVDIEEV